MKREKKVFKLEIEYLNEWDLTAMMRTIKGFRTQRNGSFTQGTARAIVTHYQVNQEKEGDKEDFEFIERKPDRIEEINGKTHYIYKSKL